MADALATLTLLIALELVLGVDNIVVISIIVARLPEQVRQRARLIGLGLAMLARLVMVASFSWVLKLEDPILGGFSVRDLVLIGGGGFLVWKAVREIHETVELIEHKETKPVSPRSAFWSAIGLILVLDMVFAIDSVVTAVGLTDQIWVIAGAVIVSFGVLLVAAGPIGDFVIANPTFKILALSFLITIGIVLILEGMHHEVPKPYIYLPMGFATAVQLLQWRLMRNEQRKRNDAPPPA